jgi:hypothetical protein
MTENLFLKTQQFAQKKKTWDIEAESTYLHCGFRYDTTWSGN